MSWIDIVHREGSRAGAVAGAGAKGSCVDDSAGLALPRRLSHRLADLADAVILSDELEKQRTVRSSE